MQVRAQAPHRASGKSPAEAGARGAETRERRTWKCLGYSPRMKRGRVPAFRRIQLTMPFRYTIDQDKELLVVVAEGAINDHASISLAQGIAADPKYHSGLRMFTDFTQVTRNGLTQESLGQIGRILKLVAGPRRVLVIGNIANYGVGRMYQTYCELNGLSGPEIFWNRDDALTYLNEGATPGKIYREA